MNWSDVGNLVGRAAPYVGAILGGPGGAAIGGMIANELGTESTPDAISAALTANPDALAKIKELEITSKVQMRQIDAQARIVEIQAEGAQYAAEAADRDSARKLAAAQPHDFVRPTLTFMMLGGSLFIVVSVLIGWATDVIKDPTAALTVGTVLGLWLGMTKEVMGFWFGMTKESQKQSAAITDFATAAGTVTKPEK